MSINHLFKRPLKYVFGFILVIPFLMSAGCPGFQRSPCNYDTEPVRAYISHFSVEQDSVVTIWFKAIEEQRSWVWDADSENRTDVSLHSSEFERNDLKIDPETAADTSILYLVNGSFMYEGTCSPVSVESVEML